MTESNRPADWKNNIIFDFLKIVFYFLVLGSPAFMPVLLAIWALWEWEPFKGRNFHRLIIEQSHELDDDLVSVLHEMEIRVDPENQRVLARVLRPDISPPVAIFYRGINYDDLSIEDQRQMDFFNLFPRKAVYNFSDCLVFSGTNWSCTVDPNLQLFTYSDRIGMNDGNWTGIRGEVLNFRIIAWMRKMQCQENICEIQSSLSLEDMLSNPEWRLDQN